MSIKYTEAQIIEKLNRLASTPDEIYSAKIAYYTGETKDTKKYYSELIADFLLKNDLLEKMLLR